jgi:ABC-type transporter Mla subunit MlaD
VQEGKPDRIADLLEEAADAFDSSKDRLIRIMGTFDLATGHADTMDQTLDALESELRDVLGYLRARREWVGLATEEAREFYESDLSREELIHKIDEFLQEKNT